MPDTIAIARELMAAHTARALYSPPSATAQIGLDTAYTVQRAFVELVSANDSIVGYKAAANAATLQQVLSLSHPVIGVLFQSGRVGASATVSRARFRTLLLETEIGFRTAKAITEPLATIDEVQNAVASVAPMIELADPGFGRAKITGTDLIAANAASAAYIEGSGTPATSVDLANIRVAFDRDGVALHAAAANELMGDQWRALQWLINAVLARGYRIERHCLLMTGALGGAHPATAGNYRADFGALGEIRFAVE